MLSIVLYFRIEKGQYYLLNEIILKDNFIQLKKANAGVDLLCVCFFFVFLGLFALKQKQTCSLVYLLTRYKINYE